MEQRDGETGGNLVLYRLVLFFLDIGHLFEVLLLQDQRLESVGLVLVHLVEVVLAPVELVVVHPAESSDLLMIVQE